MTRRKEEKEEKKENRILYVRIVKSAWAIYIVRAPILQRPATLVERMSSPSFTLQRLRLPSPNLISGAGLTAVRVVGAQRMCCRHNSGLRGRQG